MICRAIFRVAIESSESSQREWFVSVLVGGICCDETVLFYPEAPRVNYYITPVFWGSVHGEYLISERFTR